MTKAIRVGLVGSKFAARFHWNGIRRVYGVPVEVVGVTSKTAEARNAFAREKGIRSFETFEEMCAAVDVVDLCTPPSSHEHLAVRALEQGKHVIIEKPLTGYFDSGAQGFKGNSFPKETMLREEIFRDIYVTEKLGTKQGWSHPAPDEAWQHGYPQEFQDFMESIYHDRKPLSGMELARDTIAVIYSGYLSAERGGAEVPVPPHP
jgi:predicted dehydrogenase